MEIEKMPVNTTYSAKWTGTGAIPAVGQKVVVTMNRFGPGTVTGHVVRDGYLAVLVELDSPPEWYVSQCAKKSLNPKAPAAFFGTEIRP